MFITTMTDNIIFNILGLISILIHILRLFASNIARWTSYNHNPHLIESKKCSLSYLLSWYNLHFAVWRTCIVYRLAMFIMRIIYLINIITSRATDKGTQPSSFNEHWLDHELICSLRSISSAKERFNYIRLYLTLDKASNHYRLIT